MKKNIILLLLAVSIIPILIIQWVLIFPNTKETITEQALSIHQKLVLEEGKEIDSILNSFRARTRLAALYPPIQGLIRSYDTGIDPKDQSTYEQWKMRLQTIFSAELTTDTDVFQMRYLDETGQEIIRVDQRKEQIYIVPDSELQDKSDRYYFQNIMKLENGEIYISPMDLNVESGKIEIPYVPTLRFGIPVFDERTGDRKGAIVVNTFAETLLKKIRTLDDITQTVLIDNTGQFLVHPDKNKLFEIQLGHGQNYFLEHPELREKVSKNNTFTIYDETDGQWQVWQKVFYNPQFREDYWVLFKVISEKDLLKPLFLLRQKSLLITFLSVIFTIIVAFLIGTSLTRPLGKITGIARLITKGNRRVEFPSYLLKRRDEVGQLTEAFQAMTRSLNEIYDNLELEVQKKTESLQKQNLSLSDTQKALSNVLEDISQEKEKLQEQILETQKFQQAVEYSTDGIIITDPDGGIIYVNKSWQETNGYTLKEVVGKTPSVLQSGKTPPEVYEKLWKTVKQGKVFQTESIIDKKKNGTEYPVEMSIVPIKENKKILFYLCLQQDITKRKEIDKAKTEFVSLASHQLRTPLTAISWFSDMLLDGDAGKLGAEQKKYIQQIHNSNKRMITLVNSLLNVSRIELGTLAVDPQEVSLKEVAESVLEEMMPIIKQKKITFTKKYDAGVPTLMADQKLIRIIFQNLLSNAVKYTPEKGKVNLHVGQKGKGVCIQVKDTGYGIPKNQISKIFTKLFRADNAKLKEAEGNGLGLYLVKSIVEKAKGKITFTTQENKGTTFIVCLPYKGMQRQTGKDFS